MKTIEAAAIEYCSEIEEEGVGFILRSPFESFKAGAEFAQRWISVEDELPALGVPVTCKYNMFGKEYYWSGTFYTKERVMHFVKRHLMITHWRLIELK